MPDPSGTQPLTGKVAIVTGAGGGIGRAHALALARYGAKVLVNDYGGKVDGVGVDPASASAVAEEIVRAGGEAIADGGDVGSWADAETMVAKAIDRFGAVDVLVNNAGILRPKTLVGMAEADVTSVLHVHLMGTFAMTHYVSMHWRERSKERGIGGGRLINTTSAAGLFGFAQANYAAAKAGIAALTQIAAIEFARYGATANAIAPTALTRMSEGIAPENHTPEHAAELACWLATEAAAEITGRVFNVGGGHVSVVDRWHTGESADKDGLWTLEDLGLVLPQLVANAAAHPDTQGFYPGEPRSPLLPKKIDMPSGASR